MTAKTEKQRNVFFDKKIVSPGNKGTLCRIFRSEVTRPLNISFEHRHTAFEITMVVRGSGKYSTNVSDFEYKKEDIFCFSNDEAHKITKLYEKSEFITLHFEPRFIWSDKFGIADYDLLEGFFKRRKGKKNKIASEESAAQVIKKHLLKAENEFLDQRPHFETAVKVNLVSILIEISRNTDVKAYFESKKASTASAGYIEKAMNYIDENLEYDLELEAIAKTAKMSKNYFSSLFKKLNGISPWEYITIKRIERAVEYLKTTNYTKLEIATKCGFNNTANFYYAFKKITGKTPSDYIGTR